MPAADPQLTLPWPGTHSFGSADFLPAACNAAARQWLAVPEHWPSRRLVLWGPAGSGKTHLARRWAGGDGLWLQDTLPRDLIDPGGHARIVIDRADLCTDHTTLLHWLNACAEAGRSLLMTAHAPPSRWPAPLADVQSRLRATQAVAIDPPDDALLRSLLARLLADRQLIVPAAVQDWLLLALPRTAAAIQQAVAQLDATSLARHQPVTRALARACLGQLLGE